MVDDVDPAHAPSADAERAEPKRGKRRKAAEPDRSTHREWQANGREIADFLNRANPRNWSRAEMRRMMKAHLDQTISEAVHRLEGDYAADVRDYDTIHRHILMMADTLSDGIIKQFPRRFR